MKPSVMKRLLSVIGVTLLLSLHPLALLAEEPAAELTDLSLEELMNVPVSGASRFVQPQSQAPSSVTVVTRDDIKKYGYRTLADILRSLRGFQVTNDRAYSYVGVRGFGRTGDYNTRILLLVDGHRVNENMYDSVYVGHDALLDIDLIDRVEFIRGPGSSLYGNNAFFGVVNIITRRGGEGVKGVELSASAGSLDSFSGRATYGGRTTGGLSSLLSASWYDSAGERNLYYREFDDPTTNNGLAHDLDGEQSVNLLATLSWKDLTLQAAHSGRKKQVPTASYGAIFNDPRFETDDFRSYLDFKYDHPAAGDATGVLARLFVDHEDYYALLPYDSGAGSVVNRDMARNDWWGGELQGSKLLLKRHFVIAGAEYQRNISQRFENHDIDPYYQVISIDHPTDRWAGYLQDEIELPASFRLNLGIRHDEYQTFGGETTPRVALIWNPSSGSTVKLLYGEAFRAPNHYEIFFDSPAYAMVGNPELKPEKIRSYEAVAEQFIGDHLRLTVSAFTNRISNLIQQVTDPGADPLDPADDFLIFRNGAGATTHGVESELEGDWGNGLRGRVSYTYQESHDQTTDARLVNSPQQMAKASLIVPLGSERFTLGNELQYVGERLTVNRETTGGYLLANVTLMAQKLWGDGELSASVYNLFDRTYGDVGGDEHLQSVILQDGRSYRLKATWRF
jgi:iron complex outermembrane receptor protein